MSALIALLLPPAVALAGMRLVRLLLGRGCSERYGTGLLFALGLGTGMLVFTQIILATVLLGFNAAGLLAWIALVWGFGESLLLIRQGLMQRHQIRLRKAHLWLLLLLPVAGCLAVLGRISVVEGTVEFDAITHWVFKSKILYLSHGREFLGLMHNGNMVYFHLDYPMLVSALYTLNYGAVGGVNEFINKVWPVWMVAALCLAILSLADTWRRPRPLPIAIVTVLCFLPGTLCFMRWEGATIPMVFYSSLAAMLIVRAFTRDDVSALALGLLMLTGGAMSKFDGMLYMFFWLLMLAPVCRRRGWLKDPLVRRIAAFALVCVLPYAAYRLNRPLTHLESDWPQQAVYSPGSALRILPEILGLGLGGRFFSLDFFKWTVGGDGRLQWAGQWHGLRTLINYHLSVVPWLSLGLLGYSLWKGHCRRVFLQLTFVTFAVFVFLAFVLACVPHDPSAEAAYVLAKTGEDMGRYFYPFFVAWFLGMASTWWQAEVHPADEAGRRPDQS